MNLLSRNEMLCSIVVTDLKAIYKMELIEVNRMMNKPDTMTPKIQLKE